MSSTRWINILSTNDWVPASALPELTLSASVPVYSTVNEQIIGRTLRYEVRDEVDLWAEVEVLATATKFDRAAGILAVKGDGRRVLVAVLATNLSREQLREMNPATRSQ